MALTYFINSSPLFTVIIFILINSSINYLQFNSNSMKSKSNFFDLWLNWMDWMKGWLVALGRQARHSCSTISLKFFQLNASAKGIPLPASLLSAPFRNQTQFASFNSNKSKLSFDWRAAQVSFVAPFTLLCFCFIHSFLSFLSLFSLLGGAIGGATAHNPPIQEKTKGKKVHELRSSTNQLHQLLQKEKAIDWIVDLWLGWLLSAANNPKKFHFFCLPWCRTARQFSFLSSARPLGRASWKKKRNWMSKRPVSTSPN